MSTALALAAVPTVDEGVAGISDALVFSAMAVYTLAMLAYAVDLSGGRARTAPERSLVAASTGPGGAVPGGTVGAELTGPEARTRVGNVATNLFLLATALHLGSVVARGVAAGRVPWSDAYEFALTGSLVVSVVYVVMLVRRRDLQWLGTFVVLPVLLTLGLATALFYTTASALSPALQSSWLVIHVSVAFIASALFTVGFSMSVLQLVQHRQEAALAAGRSRARVLARIPGSAVLEQLASRLHSVAFVLWTFTLIAGGIWASQTWGSYWQWDPKEVWSFVIWVVYAAYLHARSTAGWAGARSAWIAVLGYACLLFNFLGVNYLFVGNHSYAL